MKFSRFAIAAITFSALSAISIDSNTAFGIIKRSVETRLSSKLNSKVVREDIELSCADIKNQAILKLIDNKVRATLLNVGTKLSLIFSADKSKIKPEDLTNQIKQIVKHGSKDLNDQQKLTITYSVETVDQFINSYFKGDKGKDGSLMKDSNFATQLKTIKDQVTKGKVDEKRSDLFEKKLNSFKGDQKQIDKLVIEDWVIALIESEYWSVLTNKQENKTDDKDNDDDSKLEKKPENDKKDDDSKSEEKPEKVKEQDKKEDKENKQSEKTDKESDDVDEKPNKKGDNSNKDKENHKGKDKDQDDDQPKVKNLKRKITEEYLQIARGANSVAHELKDRVVKKLKRSRFSKIITSVKRREEDKVNVNN